MSNNQVDQPEASKKLLHDNYPVQLTVKYADKLSRLTTLFRIILIIPIYILLESFIFHIDFSRVFNHKGKHAQAAEKLQHAYQAVGQQAHQVAHHGSAFFHHGQMPQGIFVSAGYMILPVFLMIVFRKKYPKWVFDFNVGLLNLFQTVFAYFYCITDKYPNTDVFEAVKVSVKYPEPGELNRFMPFIKVILAFPHIVCLLVLLPFVLLASIVSWVIVLITAQYPKVFFDFVVGYMRWSMRVSTYAFLLMTDKYPPFSFK